MLPVKTPRKQRAVNSCDICRSTKVKCDQQQPECGACQKKPNITCTYTNQQGHGVQSAEARHEPRLLPGGDLHASPETPSSTQDPGGRRHVPADRSVPTFRPIEQDITERRVGSTHNPIGRTGHDHLSSNNEDMGSGPPQSREEHQDQGSRAAEPEPGPAPAAPILAAVAAMNNGEAQRRDVEMDMDAEVDSEDDKRLVRLIRHAQSVNRRRIALKKKAGAGPLEPGQVEACEKRVQEAVSKQTRLERQLKKLRQELENNNKELAVFTQQCREAKDLEAIAELDTESRGLEAKIINKIRFQDRPDTDL